MSIQNENSSNEEIKKYYVYIFEHSESSLVKIGVTTNFITRYKTLQRQSGSNMTKWYVSEPIYNKKLALLVEHLTQSPFSRFNTNGEYYKIDFNDAIKRLKDILNSADYIKRRNKSNG